VVEYRRNNVWRKYILRSYSLCGISTTTTTTIILFTVHADGNRGWRRDEICCFFRRACSTREFIIIVVIIFSLTRPAVVKRRRVKTIVSSAAAHGEAWSARGTVAVKCSVYIYTDLRCAAGVCRTRTVTGAGEGLATRRRGWKRTSRRRGLCSRFEARYYSYTRANGRTDISRSSFSVLHFCTTPPFHRCTNRFPRRRQLRQATAATYTHSSVFTR